MHNLEPYYGWRDYYESEEDKRSPFHGREHSELYFTDTIYGYYIHPQWDFVGSETLYVKLIYADYRRKTAVIELIGEWNDALHNDIMHLKRNLIDPLLLEGINRFILIGENVLNFHGSDDCYYEEWFEEVEDGWVVALGFRDFVLAEFRRYGIDYYLTWGESLETIDWRTLSPQDFCQRMERIMGLRLGAASA